MQFAELVKGLPVLAAEGDLSVDVKGIAYDSRSAVPGSLFVAVPGFNVDGHAFIPQAAANGAVAFLVQRPEGLPEGPAWVAVPDSRKALAAVAARFYGYPARELHIVGVTGTNGKTTTTYLMRSIYRHLGFKTGLIGTIQCLIDDQAVPVERTTPESLDLQRLFRRMRDGGVTRVVMEVSSHALALHRVDPESIDTAIFTNLTQDHLDFHGDMESYYAAKERLFLEQRAGTLAVVNADDPYGLRLKVSCKGRAITYGLRSGADVRADDVRVTPKGAAFKISSPWGEFKLGLKFTGLFNVYNSLGVTAAALGEGIPVQDIVNALSTAPGVPGRFEQVDAGQDFTVIVDYAHTPDGLENVLRAAREIAPGRVISVFGCGGDRDRGKRPRMGAVSARHADFSVITSDNPRTEDPLAIIAEIEPGVRSAGGSYTVVPDRREAIRSALQMAKNGDIVVIAGKGHETYQIVGGTRYPFDDRDVARATLAEMGYTDYHA
ncbi:MAG: UDP-N-acetylmuramoyl-L-alanyl-D-glutamate--2,6-diaminopimelate ligase [Bacillota bacterium]|uniref:UDP-N-acetylmuramoyl-L-alanyl-D-glutamate--2, 6-diaminopimelate ligase n=1 Tax=Desulforudis sp. DRI-14 TaxID=3459793 RepID=UPI0034860E3D